MEHPQFFEDYAVGDSRRTLGRTITETDIVVHAGHSGDFFPHHMDAEFCRTQAFGQRIAHGTMTFAIGIGLTATQKMLFTPWRWSRPVSPRCPCPAFLWIRTDPLNRD